jgi:hypothetical protein
MGNTLSPPKRARRLMIGDRKNSNTIPAQAGNHKEKKDEVLL